LENDNLSLWHVVQQHSILLHLLTHFTLVLCVQMQLASRESERNNWAFSYVIEMEKDGSILDGCNFRTSTFRVWNVIYI